MWEGVVEKYANMQIRNQIIFPLLKPSRTIRRASIENSAKSIYEYGFRAPGMLINCWLENEQFLMNITYINPVTHQFHSEIFIQENKNKCP